MGLRLNDETKTNRRVGFWFLVFGFWFLVFGFWLRLTRSLKILYDFWHKYFRGFSKRRGMSHSLRIVNKN